MARSFESVLVFVGFVAPLLLAANCGGRAASMESDAGAGGGENEPVAGSQSGGVAGSTSGGSSASCESYTDDVSGTAPAVTVRVTNAGDSTLHFGPSTQTCDGSMAYFEIQSQAGGEPRRHWQPRCESSCETQRRAVAGCTGDCRFTPVIRLAPGASYDFTWQGTLYDFVGMPARCMPSSDGTASDVLCSKWRDAPEGSYVFAAAAYPESVCEMGTCTCRGDEEACMMQGFALVRGEPESRSASLDYPAGNLVEIVFD